MAQKLLKTSQIQKWGSDSTSCRNSSYFREKVEEEEKLAVADETTAITNQEEAKPQNIDSNTIITVPKVWDSGYKGEGTVVAIIDSGLDVDHDVLHISDLSTAKYKSEKR